MKIQSSGRVRVAHRREMRGAWVSTVWNINFPSSSKLTAAQQKKELDAMVDRLADCGFNAVFFQVRPEGDALYKSSLEPWSSSLTGQQGKDPGYDPLEYLIKKAHEKSIQVHAWLNPYRAGAASKEQVKPHLGAEHPEVVHPYGSYKWMDPGSPVVRQRLVDVCTDLTRRYDLDGLHFDDYFYPYPNGTEFPDSATFPGGNLGDWRRANVNQAIREVHEAVTSVKPHVQFGVSPFGMPAPDRPEGTAGFDQYHGMFADPQKWMDEGWVDYLAPQLYWPTTAPKQPYEKLLNWWADHSQPGRPIFAGNDLTQKYGAAEYRREVALSRSRPGSEGNLWWNLGPVMGEVGDLFKRELYASPALPPALRRGTAPEAPEVDGSAVAGADVRSWTVYRPAGEGWELARVVPGSTEGFTLPAGRWAVAAVSRSGQESEGVVTDIV